MPEHKTYTVYPFHGVERIRFGLSRQACRELIAAPFRTFRRSDFDPAETDAFHALGMQLSFDPGGRLEFIELAPPARVRYLGVELLAGQNLSEVISALLAQGLEGARDEVGIDYPTAGFGLYAPDETLEAVSVYRRGYYDTD